MSIWWPWTLSLPGLQIQASLGPLICCYAGSQCINFEVLIYLYIITTGLGAMPKIPRLFGQNYFLLPPPPQKGIATARQSSPTPSPPPTRRPSPRRPRWISTVCRIYLFWPELNFLKGELGRARLSTYLQNELDLDLDEYAII